MLNFKSKIYFWNNFSQNLIILLINKKDVQKVNMLFNTLKLLGPHRIQNKNKHIQCNYFHEQKVTLRICTPIILFNIKVL